MNWWVLVHKVHFSWLVAFCCLGVLVGAGFSQNIHGFVWSSTSVLLIAIVLIVLALWRRYVYLVPIIIIGGFLFGLWRGSLLAGSISEIDIYYDKNINFTGRVSDDVDIGVSDKIVIRLGNIIIDSRSMSGTFWVTMRNTSIKRGDRLDLNGNLKKGFGNFAGVVYNAKLNKIASESNSDVALMIRDWFVDLIKKAIPEPESSLGIGYLVGQRRALPADLSLALQVAGLTHIVVASGYNLTILVRLARRMLAKISKYLAALSASMMIVLFIAVTGLSPSMSRAGLVAGLCLAAWYYGRKFHPIIILLLVATVTVLINPSYIWGDLGWQLSFAAFSGVMIFAPLLKHYLFGDKKINFMQQILLETVSAQIVTAPILMIAFGQLSNVAIISNLLILPLVPLAMLLTFIAGIGALVIPWFAVVVGLPATLLLGYMIKVAFYFSNLPWSVSSMSLDWYYLVVMYFVIVIACIYMWCVTKYNLRDSNIVQ